jgi:hypothetical protein
MGTTDSNGVYFGGRSERRSEARHRLEKQLELGTKPRKNGVKWSDYKPEELIWTVPEKEDEKPKPIAVKLTEKDRARIAKELSVLIG